jgi:hypothetical protein
LRSANDRYLGTVGVDSNFRVHMVPVGLTHNPKRKGMKFYSKKTPMLKSTA